jgi:hypothetical protein
MSAASARSALIRFRALVRLAMALGVSRKLLPVAPSCLYRFKTIVWCLTWLYKHGYAAR